jgi:hypothetical protein
MPERRQCVCSVSRPLKKSGLYSGFPRAGSWAWMLAAAGLFYSMPPNRLYILIFFKKQEDAACFCSHPYIQHRAMIR